MFIEFRIKRLLEGDYQAATYGSLRTDIGFATDNA